MFEKRNNSFSLSDRALEMIMRDVLDGLEELATKAAMRAGPRGCKILYIRPNVNRPPRQPHEQRGAVVDFCRYKKAV